MPRLTAKPLGKRQRRRERRFAVLSGDKEQHLLKPTHPTPAAEQFVVKDVKPEHRLRNGFLVERQNKRLARKRAFKVFDLPFDKVNPFVRAFEFKVVHVAVIHDVLHEAFKFGF